MKQITFFKHFYYFSALFGKARETSNFQVSESMLGKIIGGRIKPDGKFGLKKVLQSNWILYIIFAIILFPQDFTRMLNWMGRYSLKDFFFRKQTKNYCMVERAKEIFSQDPQTCRKICFSYIIYINLNFPCKFLQGKSLPNPTTNIPLWGCGWILLLPSLFLCFLKTFYI